MGHAFAIASPHAGKPTAAWSHQRGRSKKWAAGVTKIVVVMEENHSLSEVFPTGMPYLYSLATTYGQATSWSQIRHPSLPNYLAIFGGSTFGVTTDCAPTVGCDISAPSVFGQALIAGKTAKSYAESATRNCQSRSGNGYTARHVPWVYFTAERTQCDAGAVPLGTTTSGALDTDIAAGTLPSVAEVVPNLEDDAHTGTLAEADAWLQAWIPKLMSGPDYRSGDLAIVVTFDEGSGASPTVPLVVIHPSLDRVTVDSPLDHYALTRLIDEVLGTAPLRNAANAPDVAPLFGLSVG